MDDRARVLVPLAFLGAGLLLFGGGGAASTRDQCRSPGVRAYVGRPGGSTVSWVDLDPSHFVLLTVDVAHQCGLLRVVGPGGPREYRLLDSLSETLNQLCRVGIGDENLVLVHRLLGETRPGPGQGELEDEPSMELVPIWINRAYVSMIGPSPVGHYRRKKLGKIYTTDGLAIELHESLSTLRGLVGPGVLETQETNPR